MATKVYGRTVRSSGGAATKKFRRHAFATVPEKSEYRAPKPGFVGPPAPAEGARHAEGRPYSNPHLRLRWLPCGHQVFMIRGQFPDVDSFCIQCRDGRR